MDEISPVVVTSRAAQKDLDDIQSRHSDIVKDMGNHAVKVAAYRSMKENEQNMINAQRLEEDRKMRADQSLSEDKKMQMSLKLQELALKERALQIDGNTP